MSLSYSIIEIFTSEESRCHGQALHTALVDYVHRLHVAARCLVLRGIAGCYESGEIASQRLEVLSYNMPIKVEIILPTAALSRVLPEIEAMVCDGIVTVRSMDLRVHRVKDSLLPRHLRVQDVMTPDPQTVTPETPASEVVRLLLSGGFHGIPVVDAGRRPIGIITQGDLIRKAGMPLRLGLLQDLEQHHFDDLLATLESRPAAQVMSRPVVTVAENAPLAAAVNQMLEKSLKRLPVVNGEGRLTGMLSRLDVFRIITREATDWSTSTPEVAVGNVHLVRDVMHRDTQAVLTSAPVTEVARIVDQGASQRVAVVDEDGRLLGIISDHELLPLLADQRGGWWRHLARRRTARPGTRTSVPVNEKSVAGDIMHKDPIAVHEEDTLEMAIRVMAENGLKRLPVVDSDGVFRGMISRDALLRVGMGESEA